MQQTKLNLTSHEEPQSHKIKSSPEVIGPESLLRNLEALCDFACRLINVDHSGFVWFRETMDFGDVVAQFPSEGFEDLLRREIQLEGVEAEQDLLNREEAIEILDVDDPAERSRLGAVASVLDEFDIKSLYIVKVRVRDEVVGSFGLDRTTEARAFAENEKNLCKTLAKLASWTIENALTNEWLLIFQEATKAIISKQEIGELLDTIVIHARALLRVESAGIYERFYDDEGEYLQLSAPASPEIFRRDDGGMAWELIDCRDGGQGYLETIDYSEYPHAARQFKETSQFGSVLEVPMRWLNERIGVLYVAGKKGRKFSKFSADQLQRVADIATVAIQRCRLLRRMENLSVAFSKGIETQSLNSRLTAIAGYATEILGAEMCGIFRVRDGERMTLEAGFGHKEDCFPIGRPFRIIDEERSGLTGAIAHRLREQYSRFISEGATGTFKGLVNMTGADLGTDKAVKGDADNSPSGECHSLLAIPLLAIPPAKGAITGLLRISNKKGAGGGAGAGIKFTPEDEWILRIFAGAASVAIERAERFSDQKAQMDLYQTFSEILTDEADVDKRLDQSEQLHQDDDRLNQDERLDEIAKQLAVVMKASYCRILFSENGSRESWQVRAASQHPKSAGDVPWQPQKGQTLKVRDQAHLKKMAAGAGCQTFSSSDPNDALSITELSSKVKIEGLTSVFVTPLTVESQVPVTARSESHVVGALEFGELRDSARGRGSFSAQAIAELSHPQTLTNQLLRREMIRKREDELRPAFQEGVVRIRQVEDVETLLLQIAKEARTLMKYDFAGVFIQRMPDGEVELIGEKGPICSLNKNDKEVLRLFEKAFEDETTIAAGPMRELCRQLGLQPLRMLVSRLSDGTQNRCGLVLTRKTADLFESTRDKQTLLWLSKQCTVSLTRAVVRERLGLTQHSMELLGQTMAHGKPEEALTNALDGIWRAIKCDSVILYKIDSRLQVFLTPYHVGDVDPAHILATTESLSDSAVGKILKLGDLHVARDATTDAIMKDTFQQLEGIKSSAGLPIYIKEPLEMAESQKTTQVGVRERVSVGVLFVNYKQPREIDDDEQRIIRSFAPFVAVAVRNQERYEREEKRRRIQEVLLGAAKTLSKSLDVTETADQIAAEAHKIAESAGRRINFVVVKLIAENRTQIISAHPPAEMNRIRTELDKGEASLDIPVLTASGRPFGVVGRAIKLGRTEIVNNVLKDDDYLEIHRDTRSQLTVLLPPLERPLGVISIESPVLNTFYDEDAETFELFAALAADAIRNAQQYADLVEARRREEAATVVGGAIALAATIAHGRKGLAQAILISATKLQSLFKSRRPTTWFRRHFSSKNLIDELFHSATKLLDDFNERHFDYDSFPLMSVNDRLTKWATKRCATALAEGAALEFHPSLVNDVRIRMQPDLLTRVLDMLLTNALAAMTGKRKKNVQVAAHLLDNETVEILVSNDGPKMSEQAWRNLGITTFLSAPPNEGRGILIACTLMKACHGSFRKVENSETRVAVGFSFPIIHDERRS